MDKAKHPIVIFIRGLPGSGKSYISVALQETLGKENVVVLDPDAIDYDSAEYKRHVAQQIAEGVEEKLHPYRFSRAKAYKAIEANKIIIWNQAFTNLEAFNKIVARLQEHADRYDKKLMMLVVEVEVDQDTAKKRLAVRKQAGGHEVSGGSFERFVNDYSSFAGKGFNILELDGTNKVEDSVAKIVNKLNQLNYL